MALKITTHNGQHWRSYTDLTKAKKVDLGVSLPPVRNAFCSLCHHELELVDIEVGAYFYRCPRCKHRITRH